MTDSQARDHIHMWLRTAPHGIFSWATDSCDYGQHIKFVEYRNEYWKGGTNEQFMEFVQQYAESLGTWYV